jgi:serine phosphatase RsbU (regulator of sigma subunit)
VSPELLLPAAGGLRRAYEEVDWGATSLGPIESWSPTLRNAVDLTLHTQFPVTLLWGPEFVLVYNEAYVQLIADKHPAALGRPAQAVFPEAWDVIGPMMQAVLDGEGATWVEDEPLPLLRRGRLEEAYFTYSYSPVRGPAGEIEGVMDIATETTQQVIDRRRLRTLGRLREILARLDSADAILERGLATLRADAADFPAVELRPALAQTGPIAVAGGVARLVLGPPRSGRAALEVELSRHLEPDAAYLGFLRLVATSIGQALDRVDAREAERSFSESLQRSLLSRPPKRPGVDIAVRYQPATQVAQVGGDWYDAFAGPHGTLTLAVGDVTGHDRRAAAAMAQIRNLLRGAAWADAGAPARSLEALDQAMGGLAVGEFATAILAELDGTTLRWCNAGHPPPAVLGPDGRARLLHTKPEPLLGIAFGARSEHSVELEPGSVVVLYTDGLVERREVPIDRGLEWLAGALESGRELGVEALCDHLLTQLDAVGDDDVALLAVRLDPATGAEPPAPG